MVFCVSYDLDNKSAKNYQDLISAIQSYGAWWHQTESVWFIRADQKSNDILETLKRCILPQDKLFVVEVKKHWTGIGFSQEEYNWLRQNLE